MFPPVSPFEPERPIRIDHVLLMINGQYSSPNIFTSTESRRDKEAKNHQFFGTAGQTRLD